MWKTIQSHSNQFVLTLFSGLILTLAFPKIDVGWLAWVALVPFLLALRQSNVRTGFLLGFIFGMAHHLGLMYWTAHTMHTYGHLPMFQAVSVLILFALYLSLYPAAFAAILCWLRPGPVLLIFMAPAAWVVLELLRASLFSGFPWALLGYSQYDHLWTIQFADLFGVYGLSGLIVLINVVLTLGLLHWAGHDWQRNAISRPMAVVGAAIATVALLMVHGYGIVRMGAVDQAVQTAKKATVAVVQGNIDQAQKWDPRFQMITTVKYRNLSLEAAKAADLVIWPETATPFYFTEDSVLSKMVIKGIQASKAHYIIGSPSFAETESRRIYHNSAYMVTPQGKATDKYDKVHLVPFGEYVPMQKWLPFIDKMVAQVGDFRPGNRGDTLKWLDNQAGMLICYEIIFPGLARSLVQNGADLLVNITNDAWFGRTSAAYQHFSMAVFRAVESRRFLARAANTGISGFIDPNGRITHATALYTETTTATEVALLKSMTSYAHWGDWPIGLLSFGLLLPALGFRAHREWPLLKRGANKVDQPGQF